MLSEPAKTRVASSSAALSACRTESWREALAVESTALDRVRCQTIFLGCWTR